jgi:chromosome segregation ATPase
VRDAEAELNRAKQERVNLQQQLSSKTSELQNQRDAISQLERILNDK